MRSHWPSSFLLPAYAFATQPEGTVHKVGTAAEFTQAVAEIRTSAEPSATIELMGDIDLADAFAGVEGKRISSCAAMPAPPHFLKLNSDIVSPMGHVGPYALWEKAQKQLWYYELYYQSYASDGSQADENGLGFNWVRQTHGQGGWAYPDDAVSIGSKKFDGKQVRLGRHRRFGQGNPRRPLRVRRETRASPPERNLRRGDQGQPAQDLLPRHAPHPDLRIRRRGSRRNPQPSAPGELRVQRARRNRRRPLHGGLGVRRMEGQKP